MSHAFHSLSRRGYLLTLLVAACLLFLAAAGAAETLWTTLDNQGREGEVPLTNETFSRLAERLRPAVVNISTTMVVKRSPVPGGQPSPFGERDPFREFWEKFFGGQIPQEYETKSLGSGVIIHRDGYILTNYHVVQNATEITVTLFDGKDYPARVVGKDKKTDLALIKIEAPGQLPVAPLGDSDRLKVGEWVLAIGNPFGLAETVTAGIVSAKGRVIGAGPYDDFIQTDASINPGNSGGPLFNFRGEVVGINTAIVATGQGIGFAIPINMAKEILPQLKEKGRVTRGWLGVGIQRLTPQLARSFGLKEERGALVSQVFKDSPAERAGIRAGDVILEFEGRPIKDFLEISRLVAATPPGKLVEIKIVREGKEMVLTAKIAEMKEEGEAVEAPSRKPLGLTVQDITPDLARRLGIEEGSGVLVSRVEPRGPADSAGIRRGDVIQEVNRQPVSSVEEFNRALEQAGTEEDILFLVRRGEESLYLVVSIK
jgi:serine protease Do